jgi:hypothetical protein
MNSITLGLIFITIGLFFLLKAAICFIRSRNPTVRFALLVGLNWTKSSME